MDPSATAVAERDAAYTHLRELLRTWTAAGRKTTTAGITSALKQSAVLDLVRLGFRSNAEFWEEAERRELVTRHRLDNGHWYVTMPGEPVPTDFATKQHAAPPTEDPSLAKFRGEVWSAFVDWDTEYRRFWDRKSRRAFFVPAVKGWIPSASDADRTRFIEVAPITMDIQIDWMKRFARASDMHDAVALLRALDADSPPGAFRRALETTGLLGAWRATLRSEVRAFVAGWASTHGVDMSELTEPQNARPKATPEPRAPKPNLKTTLSSPTSGNDDLRARVHRVVDVMSEDDLRELPLRGEHLLGL